MLVRYADSYWMEEHEYFKEFPIKSFGRWLHLTI